ncbi:MAG: MarR family transcriptional regulator [Litoreibacter sp.]|uniref:MarR family winged helix-turn-helix transcriptional regulator n=1 Tax=Litoreibacter sp. TaxID=1969459 RepID=UPI003296A417
MNPDERVRNLINRLARLDVARTWTGDVNPAQRAALEYLRDANQFSRTPSHVAEYLGTTRGTMSQTLKALLRKEYVREERSASDRRSISYTLTEHGAAIVTDENILAGAFGSLSPTEVATLETVLSGGLKKILEQNGSRSFGLCYSCNFHTINNEHPYCKLLSLPLTEVESEKICVEHQTGMQSGR